MKKSGKMMKSRCRTQLSSLTSIFFMKILESIWTIVSTFQTKSVSTLIATGYLIIKNNKKFSFYIHRHLTAV